MLDERGVARTRIPGHPIHPTRTGIIMTVATVTANSCTNTRYGELVITPAGVVGGYTRDGWWSLPISHRPPRGACTGQVVIDRWLSDSCAHTSDTGWDRGHHWKITRDRVENPIPLPRRGGWRAVPVGELQQMATRTAALAAGARPTSVPALLPAWAWWLWTLDLVRLPVADALGVLELATAGVEGGLPRPREEATAVWATI